MDPANSDNPVHPLHRTLDVVRRNAINLAERHYLHQVLTTVKGRIGAAAKVAGISTRQLHKLMKKHGLNKSEFKTLETTWSLGFKLERRPRAREVRALER